MNIRFNIDGTIEGLATTDVKNFLSHLGVIQDLGENDITLIYSDSTQNTYHVYDESGHQCSKCFQNNQYFWLIEKHSDWILYCFNCHKC